MDQPKILKEKENIWMVSLFGDSVLIKNIHNIFRYTDLLNADNDVRYLMTVWIQMVKKLYRSPNTCEYRVLWLVNSIK